MRTIWRLSRTSLLILMITSGLSACAEQIAEGQLTPGLLPPVVNPITEINQTLRNLPPPPQKVAVAVYNFADQTGQFKQSDSFQTLSKAVTQGGTSILIKALQDTSEGNWFTVVERERLDNLLKERSVITQMRMVYLGEKKVNPTALPPLLFAAVLFEGGIIGYDTNIQTGGIGAKLLGIGGDTKYRLDTITVYLRAVSTKTGQVLASVTTHKTIASLSIQGGIFKYIAVDKILEAEAGFTKNEPDQLAIQQAIEKAVYTMIIEGAANDIWSFADKKAQASLINAYREKQGVALNDKAGSDAKTGALPEKSAVAAAAKPEADKSTTSAIPDRASAAAKPQTSGAAATKPAAAAPKTSATGQEAKPWKTSMVAAPTAPARPAAPDTSVTAWGASVAAVEEPLRKETVQATAASDN